SRNGRFLCTHPRGLSSGRFRSVFHFVLFLRFQLYQIISAPFPVWVFFPVAVEEPLPFGVFTTLAAFPCDS
ncbi:hypothetical protein, partial [Streptomyces sp. NPDC048442]|uniref:hypothetical protein n=1 Tax=Streptomyces sp. NPDC048442 TaxID=3154823 RepID=UPI003423B6E5